MACHYLQVFSTFTTLATANLAAVTQAAASLAMIESGCCSSCSMDDAMQSCNKVRADDVSVSQVVQRMRDDLDLVQTHCVSASVLEMLLAEVDNTIDCFLQKLPESQAFQASPVIVTDVVLKGKLASTSR